MDQKANTDVPPLGLPTTTPVIHADQESIVHGVLEQHARGEGAGDSLKKSSHPLTPIVTAASSTPSPYYYCIKSRALSAQWEQQPPN